MIKTVYVCDLCGKEVPNFANTEKAVVAVRELKVLVGNEGKVFLDVCQECSDKIVNMFKLEDRHV